MKTDTHYTFEQLWFVWKNYADKMKDKGLETFYKSLTKRQPVVLGNDNICLIVENEIQVEYMKPLLNDFKTYLQSKLNNRSINIVIRLENYQHYENTKEQSNNS